MDESTNFIGVKELCKRLGVGKSTVYKLAEQDGFPRPRKIPGVNRRLYDSNEVEAYLRRVKC